MKRIIAVAVVTIIIQLSAIAGPPLICQQIEIGKTKSLPWGAEGTKSTDFRYDINNLTKDTLSLLNADMPVLARMETLRRAAIYATLSPSKNEKIADELLAKLMDRVNDKLKGSSTPGLALFDAGYFVACYEQTGYLKNYSKNKPLGKNLNSYSMVKKGVESYWLEKNTSKTMDRYEFEFAIAIVSSYPLQADHKAHLQKAVDGAKDGSLLAINLINRFGRKGQSMSELRNQIATSKY